MTHSITQKEKILIRIKKLGFVNNTWAIDNRIRRLASRISELRKEGMEFNTYFGKELGKPRKYHKDYFYYPVNK